MEMITNLHTHTTRCGHAFGTDREYIESAIAGGLKRLGFSDHAPYPFPDGYRSGIRMQLDAQENYVTSLQALREEYKDKIDIQIGYEAEYYPAFFENFLKQITKYEVNYLILGQHCIENEITGKYTGFPTTEEAFLKAYVNQTCEAMKTGFFTYFAHPDMLAFTGEQKIYDKYFSRLIGCAIDCKIPLELNLLGLRDHRFYPNNRFLELCGKMDADICIGCDAHSPDVVYDRVSFRQALEMADRFHLRLNHNPVLREVKI